MFHFMRKSVGSSAKMSSDIIGQLGGSWPVDV